MDVLLLLFPFLLVNSYIASAAVNTETSLESLNINGLGKDNIARNVLIINERKKIQNLTVKGLVVDAQGMPLPSANIIEKGTSNGSLTDFDGNYSITVSDGNAILVISYVGFVTQEIPVDGRETIDVSLKADAAALDEVVVVGYGTSSKRDLTGAVATISTEKLQNKPVVSYQEALSGQMAGVQVQQVSAAPGNEGLAVRVRGSGSITAGQDPLYVIDGYPIEGSAFTLVNPSDIESIQVLKDASSTAIYGSRGSNGVVIVTTKKGS